MEVSELRNTRVATGAATGQRKSRRAVNAESREKWRQQNLNKAFGELRKLVPTHPPDKKLSKIEILRVAIKYIKLLDEIRELRAGSH